MSKATDEHDKSSTEQPPSGANSMSQQKYRIDETKETIIREESKVPGNPNYYEKDGLRTQGDGQDHDHAPPMSFRRFMSFVAMAFLWTSAQIPGYLYGGIPPILYSDIGGADRWVWFITGNLLATAGVCPFVGALSDLLGRRYVALVGFVCLMIGQIVCATAHEMNPFIGGMTITGVGAGIAELTALAGTAELAPTSRRGLYVAALIFTIIPFCPSVIWGQLISAYSSWRYVGVLIIVYTFIGLLLVAFFYFPPPRVNSAGLTSKEIIQRIDFVGGILSICGIVLFDAGLLWGGYMYDWNSSHVLAPLILGIILMVAFVCWEIWGAKYPMFPRRLGKAPRTLILTLIITFISGANFFSVLMLWPSEAYNVYGHDPVGVGLRGMPFGFGVLGGCVVTLSLLTKFRGGNKWLLFGSSVIMTIGCGCLSLARQDNIGAVYAILLVAGFGVGGIVVPASIITTIICPDDLIATITALTLAIRVIGGTIGFTVYYNVFVQKLTPLFIQYIGFLMFTSGITDLHEIETAIRITAASQLPLLKSLPGVANTTGLYEGIVAAGQRAYAEAYPWVYYCSVAFGGVSILASLFLEDIESFMDDHVAVIIH